MINPLDIGGVMETTVNLRITYDTRVHPADVVKLFAEVAKRERAAAPAAPAARSPEAGQ